MEQRKESVAKLAGLFRKNEKFYTSKDFVESEVRSKFIDPFLEALKWDVKNEKGARYDKQEVITEDRVVIKGQVKHPDYTLCYGGERKIYIEAKQPSVDIKTNPEPALQVRRYAYTSKMPIAILTDFQELAIYDTRIKPKPNDTASTARIEYLKYDQFEEKFEELYERISWVAVDTGSFDTYWESSRDKKGTTTVDTDILNMIESWRVMLAEDMALHNESLNEFNLTSAVQKIIDRILFLRICEDKEIEKNNTLKEIAESKTNIYKKLKMLFSAANDKFNAGLFATDKWLNNLEVQDKTLITIINALYFPECPYEFSVLPVEILGSIYEQFLGKVIRFTRKTKNGHSVEVIEKPEVQKAGGVYYTPSYIVRYIVKETIGKKVDGKNPLQVAKLRFVDPACGSGSFLVGAYQYLLDWHLDYYLDKAHKTKAEKDGVIYKDARTKEYKLAIEEKKRILLNNIYGVDIDAQAVEVTKLSLFLKLLEHEGKALSSDGQANLFRSSDLQSKILPSLMNNIKCGNSLIGSDYYTERNMLDFGDEDLRKVNAFDWEKEFPQVFGDKGFDCVIGNPPYGAEFTKDEEIYLRKRYIQQSYQLDSYLIFTEKANQLMKEDALIGFIMPNTWLSTVYAEKMRKHVFESYSVRNINHYSFFVFKSATVETDVYIFEKSKLNPMDNKVELSMINSDESMKSYKIQQKKFIEKNGAPINIYEYIDSSGIKGKLINFDTLGNFVQIVQGTKPFQKGKGNPPQTDKIMKEKPFIQEFKKDDSFLPCLRGNLMNRYEIFWNRNYYISYGDWLAEPRYSAKFDCSEKLLVRQTGDSIIAAYDNKQFIARDNLYVVRDDDDKINLKYLLCLLNSTFMTWYYRTYINPEQGKTLAQVKRTHLLQLPIPSISKEQQEPLIKLADQMLTAKKQLSKFKGSDSDRKILEKRIQLIDSQINSIVYKLYGLTQEEIAVVEGK